jgi:CRISPR-associated protein Cas2
VLYKKRSAEAYLAQVLREEVQFSVFECSLDPAKWAFFRDRLIKQIDPDKDSLRFYFLGANWRRRVEHVGAKKAIDPDEPLVV